MTCQLFQSLKIALCLSMKWLFTFYEKQILFVPRSSSFFLFSLLNLTYCYEIVLVEKLVGKGEGKTSLFFSS